MYKNNNNYLQNHVDVVNPTAHNLYRRKQIATNRMMLPILRPMTHVMDERSLKGQFGWETFGTATQIPYIFRNEIHKFVAFRIVNDHIIAYYHKYFKTELFNIIELKSYPSTQAEIKLLNEINIVHCDCFFTKKPFGSDDFLISMVDVRQIFNFFNYCYHKLILEVDLSGFCGFTKFGDENMVPYVMEDNKKFMPTLYFEGETQNLFANNFKAEGFKLFWLKMLMKLQNVEAKHMEDIKLIEFASVMSFFPKNIVYVESFVPILGNSLVKVVAHSNRAAPNIKLVIGDMKLFPHNSNAISINKVDEFKSPNVLKNVAKKRTGSGLNPVQIKFPNKVTAKNQLKPIQIRPEQLPQTFPMLPPAEIQSSKVRKITPNSENPTKIPPLQPIGAPLQAHEVIQKPTWALANDHTYGAKKMDTNDPKQAKQPNNKLGAEETNNIVKNVTTAVSKCNTIVSPKSPKKFYITQNGGAIEIAAPMTQSSLELNKDLCVEVFKTTSEVHEMIKQYTDLAKEALIIKFKLQHINAKRNANKLNNFTTINQNDLINSGLITASIAIQIDHYTKTDVNILEDQHRDLCVEATKIKKQIELISDKVNYQLLKHPLITNPIIPLLTKYIHNNEDVFLLHPRKTFYKTNATLARAHTKTPNLNEPMLFRTKAAAIEEQVSLLKDLEMPVVNLPVLQIDKHSYLEASLRNEALRKDNLGTDNVTPPKQFSQNIHAIEPKRRNGLNFNTLAKEIDRDRSRANNKFVHITGDDNLPIAISYECNNSCRKTL